MKRLVLFVIIVISFACQSIVAQTAAQPSATPAARGRGQGKVTPPPIEAKPEELSRIKEKTAQIEALVEKLKAKRAAPELVTDVEVYAHAGEMLLEYPDMFGSQA